MLYIQNVPTFRLDVQGRFGVISSLDAHNEESILLAKSDAEHVTNLNQHNNPSSKDVFSLQQHMAHKKIP